MSNYQSASKSQPVSRSQNNKRVIFNARAVADRLKSLRDAAVAEGLEESAWWAPALNFEWAQLRKGNNGTQWGSVTYTGEDGISGRLTVRINGERHTGRIMPNTDDGVAEIARQVKNPNVKIEKRTKKPSIQVQKWAKQVKTAEDGVTLQYNDEGQPILPDDSDLSPYYQVASHVGEAFMFEAKERVARGLALVAKVVEMKRTDKGVTAQTILEAFNGRRPADTILSSESVGAIRRAFPNQKDIDMLTRGVIIASNTKIAALVQEYISDQAPKNAGLPLPNAMTRIGMNFDSTTGIAQMSFFDKSQPYTEDGRQKYDVGKVDGDPVNDNNVHKFVLPRSTIDGIVNMDSICFSSMGISMPVKAEVAVVDKPSGGAVGLDDVYDDEEFGDVPPPGGAPKATQLASAGASAGQAGTDQVKGAVADEDYESLLSGLSGTS